ncbi:protein I'm not dead yet 2-like [Drosophila kikkawai]|uniref:Protein I'm not dead yet 2-like n=1 Tax=Drosophila kikkawai TaxID=30033 RepID=A0A6P4IDD0_DROKI|nr:protein I'm not dead yet 2-like [Drosophila kikkawai]
MEDPKPPRRFAARNCCKYHWRGKLSVIIPILTSPIFILGIQQNKKEYKCFYMIVTMALLWITEAIPIYVTALLPVAFLPLTGLVSADVVCAKYFSDTVVMFLGGLIVALAIEYSNLHTRIALRVIRIVGGSPRRLLAGILIVTVFVSMWISNSAGTAMMCPIVKAVINEMEVNNVFPVYMTQEEEPTGEDEPPHLNMLAMVFYIAVAYCAGIGGTGTLIGTGTNLVFRGIYNQRFPNADEEITFTNFMMYCLPIVCILNAVCVYFSFLITHMGLFRPNSKTGQAVKKANENKKLVEEVMRQRYKELGPMSCHEIQVALIFILMIILLFTRRPGFFDGWDTLVNAKQVKGSAPVILIILVLFALPTQYVFFKYCCGKAPFPGQQLDSLLSWRFVHENIPWGLVFLLGGGFALAEASQTSGVNRMVADSLKVFSSMPAYAVQMIMVLMGMLVSAVNSNVVVANIMIPVLCEMAVVIKIHPLVLTLPTTVSISMCYFLPVSTPPNAMVCQYANIKTKYLALSGIVPSIIGYFMVIFNANTYGKLVFKGLSEYPSWADDKNDTRAGFNL